MRRLARFGSIFALVWASAGAEPPKPLLWRVSDADNSVYLLGSFHMLNAADYPLADSANKAFDSADKIFFEVSPEEINDPKHVQAIMKNGMLDSSGGTLDQHVSPVTWQALQAYCSNAGLPVDMFRTMKPWLAALTVTSLEIVKAGFLPELGLDKHYMEMAAIEGKKTVGLETLAEQMGVFEQMSAQEQETFLNKTLDDVKRPEDLQRLHASWRSGDPEGLMQILQKDGVSAMPAFFSRLNGNRNRAWLQKLAAFLKENTHGDAMAVVGSLHLLGADGLVELLKAEGFSAVKVE